MQVEWLRLEIQSVPVRLVFESALELMSSTQLGTFQVSFLQSHALIQQRIVAPFKAVAMRISVSRRHMLSTRADGPLWQIQGTPTGSEKGAQHVWQRPRGRQNGRLPLLPQNRPQAASLSPR